MAKATPEKSVNAQPSGAGVPEADSAALEFELLQGRLAAASRMEAIAEETRQQREAVLGAAVLAQAARLDEAVALQGQRAQEHEATQQALSAARQEEGTLRIELDSRRQQLDSRQSELETSRTELERANDALEAMRVELENTQTELVAVRNRLDGVLASASWRITRPLRAVQRLLGRS